jgi:hypothetical protein
MVRKFVTIGGVFVVLVAMLSGASLAAAPPNEAEKQPEIVYPVPDHQFEELACAPNCPYWVRVTPMPNPGASSSMSAPNTSKPSAVKENTGLVGPAISMSKGGLGAAGGGAFMATSAGAGHPSSRARSEAIRSELKSVMGQLGL